MSKRNALVPFRDAASAPLRDRLKAALAIRGLNIRSWSKLNGWYHSQVWMTLSGEREYPEIRDAIADVCSMSRAAVDRELAA